MMNFLAWKKSEDYSLQREKKCEMRQNIKNKHYMMFFHLEPFLIKNWKITKWQREKNDIGPVQYKRVKDTA